MISRFSKATNMNTNYFTAALTALALLAATPVLALEIGANVGARAQVGSSTVQAAVDAHITTAKDRADQEIDRRVAKLNDLTTQVQAMIKVSDAEKANLAGAIQAQINDLTTLKTKIDADTDTATLKTDVQSITKGYRIYVLVMPQAMIEVAADKLQTTASLFTDFSAKLQTRIAEGQAAGKDTSSATSQLNDMNAKVADVNVQMSAAVSHVSGLQPDNGDKTVQASNTAALQKARADLKVAQADLVAARKDAHAIVQVIQSWHLDASATASSSVSTQ